MRKRFLSTLVVLLTITALVLSACGGGGGAQQPTPEPSTSGGGGGTTSEQPAQKKEAVLHGSWAYDVPPKGHFNILGTTTLGMGGSPYTPLQLSPLALYYWNDNSWEPQLAESWDIDGNTITINLRKGVKWSDGHELDHKDLETTLIIGKAKNYTVWRYIDSYEVVDSHTVKLNLKDTNPVALYYVLKTVPHPYTVYGEYVEQFRELLFDKGFDNTNEEVKALLAEFDAFRPDDYVASGPFKMDVDNITEAQLTLVKRDDAWNSDLVKIDKIVIYNGDTGPTVPLVLDGKIDFSTHAFPPATEAQFRNMGLRIIRFPYYTGPAIFFNYNIYPFNRVEFRHALAYAINRADAGQVALGNSGIPVQQMSGMADPMTDTWVPADVRAKLNHYEYNPAKAEEILTSIGFTKGSDGIWVDDRGNKLEFELMVPSDFTDWSAAATNVAEQLKAFGIKTEVRGPQWSQYQQDMRAGQFQFGLLPWGSSTPHPMFSYLANMVNYNAGGQLGDTENPGMNYPLVQTYSGGEIDFDAMITQSGLGTEEEQKEIVGQLALAYNELLPNIPLFERYSNAPIQDGVNVTGWPEDGDPVLANGSADNFLVPLIVTGRLTGVE